MASERERAIAEIVEQSCKKHFPQLTFYPELLPIIQEATHAGYKAGVEEAAKVAEITPFERVVAAIRRLNLRALAEGEKP